MRVQSALMRAVKSGGTREVGGILMGEHTDVDTFRVTELTAQTEGGAFATFVRLVEFIVRPLRLFFDSTCHDYTRFNYIGEWHSHPLFSLTPSAKDHRTMHELLHDRSLGARFVVLLLVKLDAEGRLQHSVTVYTPASPPREGRVLFEEALTD